MYYMYFTDVYASLEPSDRVGDGKGPVVERDALQVNDVRPVFSKVLFLICFCFVYVLF